jgi:autotransporter-associated beta strand protein
MSVRRKNSVAIALASSFAASAFFALPARAATTVGNWENTNDGWFDWGASNGGSANSNNPGADPADNFPSSVYSYNTTTGVTLGSYSLAMTPPATMIGYDQGPSLKTEYETDSEGNSELADAVNNTLFSISVTYNSADWSAGTNYANVSLTVNTPGGGYINLGLPNYDSLNTGYPGGWDPVNYPGVTTRTLIWDYGDYVPSGGSETYAQLAGSNPGYYEFSLSTSAGGTGTFYFDNANFTRPQVNAAWNPQAGENLDGTYHWGTIANWTGSAGMPSNAGDIVTFGYLNVPASGSETVTLNGNEEFQVSVGTLNFNDAGFSYTIAQGTGGTLTLNGDVTNYNYNQTFAASTMSVTDGTAEINDQAGNHTISAPVNLATNTTIAVGQATNTFTISGNIGGTGGITLAGTTFATSVGTVELSGSNNYSGGTTVTGGTLLIAAAGALPASSAVSVTGGTLQLGAGTGVETLSSLSISTGGIFDVNNNHIIISYPGSQATEDALIRSYLVAGYNGGAWNGAGGLDSTAANALFVSGNKHYGLGYADGADMNGSSPVVAGLGAGNIEVKYTLYGDANLDGVVNGTDFGILAAHFGDQVTAWDQGDFNYDGVVNGTDFGALAANFGQQANGTAIQLPAADYAALDAFAAANGLLADVPEPASVGLMVIAGFGILSRRRRGRRV